MLQAAIGVVLLGLVAVSGSRFLTAGPAPGPPGGGQVVSVGSAATTVARVQEALRDRPRDPGLLTELGVAAQTRFKETADPTWLARADDALTQALALRPATDPGALRALVADGLLRATLHDFRTALARGEQAVALNPDSAQARGVVVDALVELGRYDAAGDSVQQMVDLRPDLASLSRVSYLRELRGDADGALSAMTAAATAGGGTPGDRAYVATLIGDLYLQRGAAERARASYDSARRAVAAYPLAELGLARVEVTTGQLEAAAARLAGLTDRLPRADAVALYGDVLAALGRQDDAAVQWGLVRDIERLAAANGTAVDLELARFNADHPTAAGTDPEATVALARAARAARPTIYGDDTLAWALRQAGRPADALPYAKAAVRLGTRDAALWWHLAAVEADLGQEDAARQHVAAALAMSPTVAVTATVSPADRSGLLALADRLGVRAAGS